MSTPPRNEGGPARELLVGLLAYQNGFVSREALLLAVGAWAGDRSRSIGAHLTGQGPLDPARLALLEALADEHQRLHGGDPEKSLATLGSSVDPVMSDLSRAVGEDLQPSIALVGRDRAAPGAGRSSRPDGRRFRILKLHAQGGLGRVYEAQDEELGRTVALKEIQPDKADRHDLRSRFVLEAEINGGLQHPGIVPVYSLGHYDDGKPFYAMRFVEGASLRDAVARHHEARPNPDPSTKEFRDLLNRFLDVCNAIGFAHSKGVLHRDLKPHNVMIGNYGEALIIDWGLAKATGKHDEVSSGGRVEETLVPPSGSAVEETRGVIGTPSYMSPEQAEGKVDELGPATDVYALGAILYHMLTGRPPFTGDGRELMDRVIHGEFLPPRSLNPNVPLTLQAVCQTAMARTPGARYPSARALADDVSRWMSDEPVSVLRDPLLTRATRWARKHRVATAAVAAGLVVGLVAALAGLQRERTHAADLDRQRRRAEAGEKDAIAAVKRFSDVIRDEPALKDSAELKDLRAKLMKEPLSFFRSLRDRLQAERDTRPESLDALAEVSLDLGLLHYELGAGQDAMDAFQGGLVVSSELAKAYPLVARYEHHRVRLLHDHANVLRVNGRLPEARRELEDVLAALRRLSSSHPEVSLYQQDLVTAPMNLALVLHDLGETAEARRVLEESAAETRKLILKDPENIDLRIALMRYTANLGVILKDLNDLSEAERADREAIELGRSILARRPGDEFHQNDLTSPQTNLGTVLERLGRYEEARALFEEALAVQRSLAERHPAVSAYAVATARTQNGLGSVLRKQDRFEEARAAFEVSRDRFQKLFDEDPQSPEHQFDLGVSRVNLAELLLAMKRPDEARKELEAALPILRRLNTARPDVLQYQRGLTLCLRLLGGMARDSGQFDPALAIFREEREILRKIAGASQGRFDDQAELAATGSNIANVLQTAGRSAEARAEFEELLSVGRRLVKERPNADNLVSMLGITISNMAVGDLAAGRVDRAADGFREAVTLQRKALDARPANILYRAALSNHLDNLSRAAQRLGRDDEASAARREMEELDANNPQYAAVDARLNAVAGGAPAVSLAESLTLGRRAFSRKLYGLATKLWDAALRSDPMLGLDRKLQLRYDASCAAALAAAGKGKEFPPPDAASKVRFRGQALGWLRAELDLWKKQLEAPNPAVREAVLRILRHWREDTDLSGVRDADALAKLPEDERKAWQALWADVEGLISAETAKKRP